MTIQQPFAEAILRGIKKVENRSRPIFPLHFESEYYQKPKKPKKIQCRFCSDDQTYCNFWLHRTNHTNVLKKCNYKNDSNSNNKIQQQISSYSSTMTSTIATITTPLNDNDNTKQNEISCTQSTIQFTMLLEVC